MSARPEIPADMSRVFYLSRLFGYFEQVYLLSVFPTRADKARFREVMVKKRKNSRSPLHHT
jgi:hypothetical protein